MKSKTICISLCLLMVMSVFVSAASMNGGNGTGSSGSPISSTDEVDAKGPYGTEADPYYEGDSVDFEAEMISGDPSDYKFRWDVNNDGRWDGPGPAGDWYFGDYGDSNYTHTFKDNAFQAKVEAWDGTSYTSVSLTSKVWDEPENPGFSYLTGYGYWTYGMRFEVLQPTTIDQIGVYRSVSGGASYYYMVKLYDSSRIPLAITYLDPGDQPGYPDWKYIDITPTLLAPGIYTAATYCMGDAYYGDYNPGPTSDGIINPLAWTYIPSDKYPEYTISYSVLPWIDIRYNFTSMMPDVQLKDTADVYVDNVPPNVFDVTATPDEGFVGTDINFTAKFDDPGIGDTWEYRWDFGDGNVTSWERVILTPPLSMPIQLQNVTHNYADTKQYDVKVEVKDDDHEKGSTPTQLDFVDFEGYGYSYPPGWYEVGIGGWMMHYAYELDGMCPYIPYYYYGVSILYSPVYDFTGLAGAILDWDNYWEANWPTGFQDGFVQVSIDGGATWTTLEEFHHLDPSSEVAHYSVGYAAAANEPWVQFRFWIDMYDDWYWEIDNFDLRATYTMQGLGSNRTLVTIRDVAANAGGPYMGDEGSPIIFDASGSTDPTNDPLQYRWDLDNDGTWDTSWSDSPVAVHTWNDDYSGTVVVEVTDGTYTDTDTASVTVNNVAPSVSLGNDKAIEEGDNILLMASVFDPGADIHTNAWDFGDGGTSTEENPQHTYTDDGTFTVTLIVTDDDDGEGSDSMVVTVLNVAPIVNAGEDMTIDEGTTVSFGATIHDPGDDTHSYSWNFGDGGTSSEPTPIHTYDDNGVYTVTLTVTDEDGGETTDSLIITVLNVAPTAILSPDLTINEGDTIPLSVIATDPSPVDTLTYEWDLDNDGLYDDGTGQSVSWNGDDDGSYIVSVRVTDDDGSIGTDDITITVNNVAPTLKEIILPSVIDEGSLVTLQATATDEGSDDLTFTWEFELGPTITNIYYNNGVSPDPYPSPGGTYPFSASDTAEHIYGDNGVYMVTLTVADDDRGTLTYTTTIIVNNVAPTIEQLGPFTVDEGQPFDFTAICSDLGSDDLTVSCEFELGPTITNVHYNDGLGPDPDSSPWGTCPFSATEMASHTYGDNGIYLLTLTAEDDDGASCTYTTTVTVNNVAPTLTLEAYMYIDFTLRVSGEKWHNVELFIYEDDVIIGYTEVIRFPGDPDEQSETITNVKCDVTKTLTTLVLYTPFDDPPNGQPNGADKGWVTLTFEDSKEETFQHNFNFNHPETWEWKIDINQYLRGHEITFEATATDQGSDDLTFTWDFGDGTTDTAIYYNDGLNPDPIQSPWGTCPFTATDARTHTYSKAGNYTFTLTVTDDDGGLDIIVVIITIN